jgi:ankyrin repeat protein
MGDLDEMADVAAELKSMLAESKKLSSRRAPKKGKAASPYDVPSAWVGKVVTNQHEEYSKKLRARTAKRTKIVDFEQFAEKVAVKGMPKAKLPREETEMKALGLPYYKNSAFVSEKMEVHTGAQVLVVETEGKQNGDDTEDSDSPPAEEAVDEEEIGRNRRMLIKFSRKYSRFLHNIDVQKYVKIKFRPRSDIWIVRLIEQCFDEATKACSKDVIKGRRRMRAGMFLGALDAFPLIVKRTINRIFGTMELRDETCIEFLIGLENALKVADERRATEEVLYENWVDGKRAAYFVSFLSEELDLDYLSMFLYYRWMLQRYAMVQFSDLIKENIHSTSDARYIQGNGLGDKYSKADEVDLGRTVYEVGSLATQAASASRGSPERFKVVPISLPSHANLTLRLVEDMAFGDCPLVSIELEKLNYALSRVLPLLSVSLRQYLVSKILVNLGTLSVDKFRFDKVDGDVMPRRGVVVNNLAVVPIYVIVSTIVEEWRSVPEEVKSTLSGDVDVGSTLRTLNVVYDDDCALSKASRAQISATETDILTREAYLMKLNKQEKKQARKFEDRLLNALEIQRLQSLRIEITTLQLELTEVRSKLELQVKKFNHLGVRIEELWDSAVPVTYKMDAGLDVTEDDMEFWTASVEKVVDKAINWTEKLNAMQQEGRKGIETQDQLALADTTQVSDGEASRSSNAAAPLYEERTILIATSAPVEPKRIRKRMNFAVISWEANFVSQSNLRIVRQEALAAYQEAAQRVEAQKASAQQAETEESERRIVVSTALSEIIEATSIRHVIEVGRMEERLRNIRLLQEKADILSQFALRNVEDLTSSALFKITNRAVNARILELLAKSDEDKHALLLKRTVQDLSLESVSSIIDETVRSSRREEKQVRVDNGERQEETEEETPQSEQQREQHQAVLAAVVHALSVKSISEVVEPSIMAVVNRESHVKEVQLLHNAAALLEKRSLAGYVRTTLATSAAKSVTVAGLRAALAARELEHLRLLKVEVARQEALQREQAGVMAQALTPNLVQQALESAKHTIDPWLSLDMDPTDWLGQVVLMRADMKGEKALKRRNAVLCAQVFQVWKMERTIRRRMIWLRHKIRRRFFRQWVLETSNTLRLKTLALHCQSIGRGCLDRRRVIALRERLGRCDALAESFRKRIVEERLSVLSLKLVVFWHEHSRKRKVARETELLYEQRIRVRTFYRWLHAFKGHQSTRHIREEGARLAQITIACMVRCNFAKKRMCERRATHTICVFAKHCCKRRVVRASKLKMERYSEVVIMVRLVNFRRNGARYYRTLRRLFLSANALRILFRTLKNQYVRNYFLHLKRETQGYHRRRYNAASAIQSAGRMIVAQKRFFNYYKLRRGLRAVQGLQRRYIAMRIYHYQLFFYRRVNRIQKVYRGWYLRKHMTEARIRAIHYAAGGNNYDRLAYLVSRFGELVHELDHLGNSPIHSAAKNAARRTLKLLIKNGADPNAVNLAGFTPLHLTIMSKHVNRDDCVLYMLDRGFDEEMATPDGKTCLLLACENGRVKICSQLLENGLDPNVADNYGTTPLQCACSLSLYEMVRELVNTGADVNRPGFGGRYALHDIVGGADFDLLKLLLSQGAYINVSETQMGQTPLMWAAAAGLAEWVHLLTHQGGTVDPRDFYGWTVCHHGALSDSHDVFDMLREADVNFDAVDEEGNTPLHVAAQNQLFESLTALLELGAIPDVQNVAGDQPAHICARNNDLRGLQKLCQYDKHIGRVNYSHQTPLGVATFHDSQNCKAFLEEHYVILESALRHGRDAFGFIWWDKQTDEEYEGWRVEVTDLGDRTYINEITGEVRDKPPAATYEHISHEVQYAEVPMRSRVVKNFDDNTLTKYAYQREFGELESEIQVMARIHRAATCITKYARVKLAKDEMRRRKIKRAKEKVIRRFLARKGPKFNIWNAFRKFSGLRKIQASWRSFIIRKRFYAPGGEYSRLWLARARLILKMHLWHAWKSFQLRREYQYHCIKRNPPRTILDWGRVIKQTGGVPKRLCGAFEEFVFPNAPGIFFYRHSVTGSVVLRRPASIQRADKEAYQEKMDLIIKGFTVRQVRVSVMLQALWRGYSIRNYFVHIESAMNVAMSCETLYLEEPDSDKNLWNYMLFCHVVAEDIPRARQLYHEATRRMEYRGPDNAFVLYAYAVFAFVYHDLDYPDIILLLSRARAAEQHKVLARRAEEKRAQGGSLSDMGEDNINYGKIFRSAFIGFYKHQAREKDSMYGWHNFAACRFLIYNDFSGSFDAFLSAFRWDAKDAQLKANFDIMMRNFHGTDKEELAEIVVRRMRYHAAQDDELQNQRRARREHAALRARRANQIKQWYKDVKSQRIFKIMRQLIADAREKRLRKTRNKQTSLIAL